MMTLTHLEPWLQFCQELGGIVYVAIDNRLDTFYQAQLERIAGEHCDIIYTEVYPLCTTGNVLQALHCISAVRVFENIVPTRLFSLFCFWLDWVSITYPQQL